LRRHVIRPCLRLHRKDGIYAGLSHLSDGPLWNVSIKAARISSDVDHTKRPKGTVWNDHQIHKESGEVETILGCEPSTDGSIPLTVPGQDFIQPYCKENKE